LGVLLFIGNWNSFFWPLVATHSEAIRTLPVGLATLKESFRDTTPWPLLMAGASVATLPMLCLFMLTQRWVMRGFASGGLKE
jgi:multiple sugar transport system permease protein